MLFNDRGPATSGTTLSGGDFPVNGIAVLASDQLAYLASTNTDTSTGSQTGQVILVNTSDPSQLAVAGTLDIPGTEELSEIAIDGNDALVVGNTGDFTTPVPDSGNDLFDGNVTLTLLDITNPDDPQIVTTQVLPETLPSGTDVGSKVDVADLGDGVFAVTNSVLGSTPQLLVVGTSDLDQPGGGRHPGPGVRPRGNGRKRPALRRHRAGAVDLPDRYVRQRARDGLGSGGGPDRVSHHNRSRGRLVQHRTGPDDARDQFRHRGLEPRAGLRQFVADVHLADDDRCSRGGRDASARSGRNGQLQQPGYARDDQPAERECDRRADHHNRPAVADRGPRGSGDVRRPPDEPDG